MSDRLFEGSLVIMWYQMGKLVRLYLDCVLGAIAVIGVYRSCGIVYMGG